MGRVDHDLFLLSKHHFYSSFTKLNKLAQFIFKICWYIRLELKTGFRICQCNGVSPRYVNGAHDAGK